MSYYVVYYHIIFRTYRSMLTIPVVHERELYAYINGITSNLGCKLHRIGGMPDHIHMLISIPPHVRISDYVKKIKEGSTKWLRQNPNFQPFYGWANGYAVFSYSKSEFDNVKNYIINQKAHHAGEDFAKEYRRLIEEHGGQIDERYFLVDDE